MCKKSKNYRILLYTITEKQRREVASGVNVDPTVVGGLKTIVNYFEQKNATHEEGSVP